MNTVYHALDFWGIMGIAVSLAMDAFAVSITAGITLKRISKRQTFRLAWHFGLFQAMMPVIGWALGYSIREYIEGFDHWVVFVLLGYVSFAMIRSSLSSKESTSKDGDPTKGWTMVMLSIATSIDALAIGLSLSLIRVSIWIPALYIGIVAGGFTTLGMYIGSVVGRIPKLNRFAEAVGGLILLSISIRILIEHNVFS